MTLIQPNKKRHLLFLSDIGLIMVAILWGSSYGVAKISLAYYPVLGFLAVRFGLTSLLLLPSLWKTYKKNSLTIKQAFRAGLPLGFLLWLVFIFETFAILYTSVANVAFLISLCLIMTPFFEWIFLKNKPSTLVFACAFISLIGTYLLVMPNGFQTQLSFRLGDALVLIAAMCRALLMVFTKKRLINNNVSAINITAVQSLVVFLCSSLLFVLSQTINHKPMSLPTASTFWLATIYLVLLCTVFAFFVQNWAIKIASPSRASLLMGTEPLFGALFAVFLFGDTISVFAWFGGGLIVLSSVLLMSQSFKKH